MSRPVCSECYCPVGDCVNGCDVDNCPYSTDNVSLDDATPEEWDAVSALDKQVGGDHYKNLPIEPIEYIYKNNLGYCEANVVKYITRYANKGGVQDLDKVIHYVELLKELKYGGKRDGE